MCLIVFAWGTDPDLPLVLAANRDEFHARPTAAAGPWPDAPAVVGGRDLEAGGSWLAAGPRARLAALTNVRDARSPARGSRSRGLLVARYVAGSDPATGYLARLRGEADAYGGFNLLLRDGPALLHFSNRGGEPALVAPGIHGLSNHLLDTPWPKVESARAALRAALTGPRAQLVTRLFAALADRSQPVDAALPDTGVGLARERLLAPVFIAGDSYGTRCSTVLLCHADGTVLLEERRFGPGGQASGRWQGRISPG